LGLILTSEESVGVPGPIMFDESKDKRTAQILKNIYMEHLKKKRRVFVSIAVTIAACIMLFVVMVTAYSPDILLLSFGLTALIYFAIIILVYSNILYSVEKNLFTWYLWPLILYENGIRIYYLKLKEYKYYPYKSFENVVKNPENSSTYAVMVFNGKQPDGKRFICLDKRFIIDSSAFWQQIETKIPLDTVNKHDPDGSFWVRRRCHYPPFS